MASDNSQYVSAGSGGLQKVTVRHSASGAEAEIYLWGATLLSYKPAVHAPDALFHSSRAVFDGAKPIRGGVPVVFPQFGMQGSLPMHGFARTSLWTLASVGDGTAELTLSDTDATRALWPHAFHLRYRVTFNGPTLTTALEVTNPASAAAPFYFEALLHSYLATGANNVKADGSGSAATVCGLRGVKYLDKPSGGAERTEESDAFELAGEVDRVYQSPGSPDVTVRGLTNGPFTSVTVRRTGALRDAAPALRNVVAAVPLDVVVWNPSAARAAAIADLGPDDWHHYVCIEPGRVSPATKEGGNLAPGKAFTLTQTLTWA